MTNRELLRAFDIYVLQPFNSSCRLKAYGHQQVVAWETRASKSDKTNKLMFAFLDQWLTLLTAIHQCALSVWSETASCSSHAMNR